MKKLRKIYLSLLLILLPVVSFAQKQPQDSLVRLLEAKSAELIEKYGRTYRKVIGPARFLHNNTYLICDTAFWDVQNEFIDAIGRVQLAQDGTLLTSDKLHYKIQENLAEFRGSEVRLIDKEKNTLKTRYLDYNTKDSIAVFKGGASMKDKDGNIIESNNGTYESKENTFFFEHNVNFFSDSLFMKSMNMTYNTANNTAYFGRYTYLWQGDNFLSAHGGWYDRENEKILFTNNVFGSNPEYEFTSDSAFYDRPLNYLELSNNAQVIDTANQVILISDKMTFTQDSLGNSFGDMLKNPVFIYYGENENNVVDSLFAVSDIMHIETERKFRIPESETTASAERIKRFFQDPIAEMKKNKAAEAAKEREEKLRQVGATIDRGADGALDMNPNLNLNKPDSTLNANNDISKPQSDSTLNVGVDSLGFATDSLGVALDSLGNVIDSLSVAPIDSTEVMFLRAHRNVKIYRSDIQVLCDSLVFTDLDSIARLYQKPVLWNEATNQLSADEMQLLVQNGALSRGSMAGNAFITTEEDSVHYNQIKSVEMIGHFKDNELTRFDAFGGVSAIFYLVEEGEITTVNIKNSTMMMSLLKNNRAEKNFYYDAPKNDAHPLFGLDTNIQRLKDFHWRGDERPKSRYDITNAVIKPSSRGKYTHVQFPQFRQSEIYFPGYIRGILKDIEIRKINKENAIEDAQWHTNESDSIAVIDSIPLPPSDPIITLDTTTTIELIKDSLLVLDKRIVTDTINTIMRDSLMQRIADDTIVEEIDDIIVEDTEQGVVQVVENKTDTTIAPTPVREMDNTPSRTEALVQESIKKGHSVKKNRFKFEAGLGIHTPIGLIGSLGGSEVSIISPKAYGAAQYYFNDNLSLGAKLLYNYSTQGSNATAIEPVTNNIHNLRLVAFSDYHFMADRKYRPFIGVGVGGSINAVNTASKYLFIEPRVGIEMGKHLKLTLDMGCFINSKEKSHIWNDASLNIGWVF